ncbi:MAG: CDP-alcohol phosphatidyltransferase family protein [Treponema sp.]|jgi:phosphatidylglycerophosphate synthase|nr:CDP-alcohol phosphatidyltransferase family protein [Treponema sp.]
MALARSIIKTLLAYCLIQVLVFFVFFRLWGFSGSFFLLFLGVQLVFYPAILVFLLKNQAYFYHIRSGERETVLNGANKITLFRISMLPLLVFLTRYCTAKPGSPAAAGPVLAGAFALTFATDFVDGRIARTRGLETYIGRILDSVSDYLLLGVSAGAFFFFRILKPWLFWAITGRLIFNSLVMLILFLVRKELRPQTTPMGKLAIAVIMILLVIEAAQPVLRNLAPPGATARWIGRAELAAAMVIVISMIDKLIYLIRGLRRGPGANPEPVSA